MADFSGGKWVGHVFREQNAEADRTADIAASSGSPMIGVIRPKCRPCAVRVQYDGTAGKTRTAPAIGVVVYGAEHVGQKWMQIMHISIPICLHTSSVQTELLACATATKAIKFYTENDRWPTKWEQIEPLQNSTMCFSIQTRAPEEDRCAPVDRGYDF